MLRLALIPAMLAATLLAACGSDPELADTKGQELMDLQSAYKERAITADEYEDQKEEVLDK